MWHRKNDPHNAEELMISEYYRRLDELKEISTALEIEKTIHSRDIQQTEEVIAELRTKIAELKNVIKQTDGVIDLHTPVKAYFLEVPAQYYLEGYLKSNFETIEEKRKFISEKQALNDVQLYNWASTTVLKYGDYGIKIKEFEFKHCIQVPFYPEPLKFLIDPQLSRSNLYEYIDKPHYNKWVVCPLDDLKKIAVKAFREHLSGVFEDLKDDEDDDN